ncbi:MAG: glutathione S-transferase [Gammaproteobacteria bacterium]|nr:glutathione S-transferase [Gammaproteobacteria bacterium]
MLKLYGFRVSNYYNMLKFAFLEKGIKFEEVHAMPNQETEFTSKSPMGKVPCIEVDGAYLSETGVILDYLEDISPSPALFPSDAFQKAKARELLRCCELYIELAARRHYGHLFFGEDINEAAVNEVKPVMEKGVRAISQLARFSPYLCGEELSYADIVAYHCFSYPVNVAEKIYDWDIISDIPGLKSWKETVAAREHCKTVDSEWLAALNEFQNS